MNIYDFSAENVYGDEVSLKEYHGKVLLIVNSATECGFTPQYDDLESIYEKYAAQDFDVLEFPCNQFGRQAPGSNEQIASFCDAKFGLKFSRFSKVDVNGDKALPLFKYLHSLMYSMDLQLTQSLHLYIKNTIYVFKIRQKRG